MSEKIKGMEECWQRPQFQRVDDDENCLCDNLAEIARAIREGGGGGEGGTVDVFVSEIEYMTAKEFNNIADVYKNGQTPIIISHGEEYYNVLQYFENDSTRKIIAYNDYDKAFYEYKFRATPPVGVELKKYYIQEKLISGTGITIDGNTISATGGGGDNVVIKSTEYAKEGYPVLSLEQGREIIKACKENKEVSVKLEAETNGKLEAMFKVILSITNSDSTSAFVLINMDKLDIWNVYSLVNDEIVVYQQGGTGGVTSVNGKSGEVNLISKDIPVGGEDTRTLDQAVADSIEKINDKTGKEIVIRAEDIPYEAEGLSVHDEIFGKQNKLTAGEGIKIEGDTISATSGEVIIVPDPTKMEKETFIEILQKVKKGADITISTDLYTQEISEHIYVKITSAKEDRITGSVLCNDGYDISNYNLTWIAEEPIRFVMTKSNSVKTIEATSIEGGIPQITDEQFNEIVLGTLHGNIAYNITYNDETYLITNAYNRNGNMGFVATTSKSSETLTYNRITGQPIQADLEQITAEDIIIGDKTISEEFETKQDKLTAGTNITIDENNVISATGGGGGNVNSVNGETGDVVLDANDIEYDTGITIKQGMDSKQDKLTAGENITIEDNVISATVDGGGLVVETAEREEDGSPKLTAEQCTQIANAVKDGKECSVRLTYTEQSVEIKMMYKVLINGVMASDRGDEGQFILLDEECREWIGYSVMGEDVRHRRRKISEGIRSINSKSGESVEITGTDIKVSDTDETTIAEKINGITITTTRIVDDIPQMSQEEALLIYNAVKSATNAKPQPIAIIYTNETTGDRQLLEMEYAETYDDVVVAFFTKDEICERYKYRITQDDVEGSIVKGSVDGVELLNGKKGNVNIVPGENVNIETEGNNIKVSAIGGGSTSYTEETSEKETLDNIEIPTLDYMQVRHIVTEYGKGTECRIKYNATPYGFEYPVLNGVYEDGVFVVRANALGAGTVVYMANGENVTVKIDYNYNDLGPFIVETDRLDTSMGLEFPIIDADDFNKIVENFTKKRECKIKSTHMLPGRVYPIITAGYITDGRKTILADAGDGLIKYKLLEETNAIVGVVTVLDNAFTSRQSLSVTVDGKKIPKLSSANLNNMAVAFESGRECRVKFEATTPAMTYEATSIERIDDGTIYVYLDMIDFIVEYKRTPDYKVSYGIVHESMTEEKARQIINETNVKTFEVELDVTTFLPVIDEKNLDEWLDYAKRGRMVVFHGLDQYQYDRTYTVQTAVNDTIMITAIATDGVAYYIANLTNREWQEIERQ